MHREPFLRSLSTFAAAALLVGGLVVARARRVEIADPVARSAPSFPLAVSSDGRWLEQADGSGFFVNGSTAWSIMVQLDLEDAELYLADRAAKGVNLVLVNLIESTFSTHEPRYANVNGDAPFTETPSGHLDFSTPNERYWAHVDRVLALAESHGIVVLAVPAYVGREHGSEGWASTIAANGPARMAAYGTFLGRRYADTPNLIWCIGGDADTVFGGSDLSDELGALATAIEATDPNHLMTAHAGGKRAREGGYDQAWLDFDTAYPSSYLDALHREVREGYQDTPAMPVLMIESAYGNEHGTSPLAQRKQMWQSVLGGAIGHVYGSAPVWYFGEDASHPANSFATRRGLDWHDVLDGFGARYLAHVAAFQAARDLRGLTPDYAHAVVVDGQGVEGPDYAPVLASSRVLVAYTPGNALTVDMRRFEAGTYRVRWYSPSDGSTRSDRDVEGGTGPERLVPPDGDDWVLLLDDRSLGRGAP